jgi:ComF family protein
VQDAVAPAFCVQCNAAGGWLCEICAEQIFFVKAQVCYRCGKLSEQGKTCQRCRRYTHLSGVLVATHYESGPVRELVHRLKYEALTDLAKILSRILLQAVEGKAWDGWTVVPVPLHPGRLTKRGFNQADLLGRRLAGYLRMPYRSQWLRRIRATEAQVELSGMHRRINVYKAFLAKQDLRGMKILLVDDVMTTGATLEDAARALKDAGAKMVWAAVVARGS